MPRVWERHFLWYEFALATGLGAALTVWSTFLGGQTVLEPIIEGNRAAIYGTAASISAALLGFLITTLAIIHSLIASEAFARLRASDKYPTLWSVLRWTIRVLAMSSGLLLVCLVLDRDADPRWPLFYLAAWAALVSAFLVARSIWILERVLGVSV
jgi:hypothetical protein